MRRFTYHSPAGEVVYLMVPWGEHTGRIPPGEIKFRLGKATEEVFRFSGIETDV